MPNLPFLSIVELKGSALKLLIIFPFCSEKDLRPTAAELLQTDEFLKSPPTGLSEME